MTYGEKTLRNLLPSQHWTTSDEIIFLEKLEAICTQKRIGYLKALNNYIRIVRDRKWDSEHVDVDKIIRKAKGLLSTAISRTYAK